MLPGLPPILLDNLEYLIMNCSQLTCLAMVALLTSCGTVEKTTSNNGQVEADSVVLTENPLLKPFSAPYGIAPFAEIKPEHYQPAFTQAIKDQLAEIDGIVNNTESPSFSNTIEALEKSGDLLDKVSNVFFAITGADTTPELQAIEKDISPKLAAQMDDIFLNDQLFARVKVVYQQRDQLTLRTEQDTLLKTTYQDFVRGGANLTSNDKQALRELNEKITKLGLQFSENLLAETNGFELVVDNVDDLKGLPEGAKKAAAKTAKERGHEGKWVFTTHRPSKNVLLTFAENRSLREQIFKAYTMRGDNNNENDNKKIAAKMASLRYQRAVLLGYPTHAHYVLEDATAKTPENVSSLLNQVWPAAINRAEQEAALMQKMIVDEGEGFKLEAWDWWYYSNKIRKAQYDLDQEAIKQYFSLENTLQGVFYTAGRLWGVSFKERSDLPKYHESVRTFEVYDGDKSLLGVYMYDPYVRESKRGGAWMSSLRKQYRMYGEDVKPIIYNVTNFPAPLGDAPALLTFDQAETLFHEFGHAIQGLLSNGYYRSQTGTALPRDYVEYPSQIMENWMMEPEVLVQFARHHETGEVIPAAMIKKIEAAGQFNQGFATTEYMAAALLDMKWHSLTTAELQDTNEFEKNAMSEIGLINEIAPRYRSTYFSHIFSDPIGYSSGYYGYIWSNIYDADTWLAFKEKGIFDQETAASYRKHVLEPGGTEDPAVMYRRFRGKDPEVRPLLERRGLVSSEK
jgi:peptidyl-dipeptidase Dcp